MTGVSTGIGLSLISSILAASHRVVGFSRDPSKVKVPATSNESNTLLLPVDLSSTPSIEKAYKSAIAYFGRIDVLINNAGYGLSAELESMTDKSHRDLFEVYAMTVIKEKILTSM